MTKDERQRITGGPIEELIEKEHVVRQGYGTITLWVDRTSMAYEIAIGRNPTEQFTADEDLSISFTGNSHAGLLRGLENCLGRANLYISHMIPRLEGGSEEGTLARTLPTSGRVGVLVGHGDVWKRKSGV